MCVFYSALCDVLLAPRSLKRTYMLASDSRLCGLQHKVSALGASQFKFNLA